LWRSKASSEVSTIYRVAIADIHGGRLLAAGQAAHPMNTLQIPSTLKSRILDKVKNNKLTIVVGPTGCGKSSIVPQLLLDGFGSPVLCTQPRRLAVVAVSSHVAEQRGSVLGEEVGYHVGQDRVASSQTGLLFATAGILLEELKGNGLEALTRYKVVLIDECHERSSESDLCLTIIKEFMMAYPRCKLRLILMSATFNHGKYTSFFRGVPGCDYVDTITIQTANNIDMFYSRVQTHYLESITKMLSRSGNYNEEIEEYCTDMKFDPMQELKSNESGKLLSGNLLELIRSLAEYLHNIEAEDKIFLIFTPTYRQLEQIYFYLQEIDEFDLGVLHASIDIEDCLQSMKGRNEQTKRKVLLASAIADSSITIPNVSCVIDTCRALEVKWVPERSKYESMTTFASQAICDQRRGRTGRTCSGRVFRLVHENFFNNQMDKFERPQLEVASCRDEALSLLSSKNKVMSNPSTLLRKCLDPPPADNVADALEYLVSIDVCRQVIVSRKRRIVLTEHGKLISALPFTVEEAEAITYGARRGMLHEALVLVAIKTLTPKPVVNAFGAGDSNHLNLSRYFPQVDVKDPQSQAVAHFAAYLFWYVNWGNIRRTAMMEHFENCSNGFNNFSSQFFGDDSDGNSYDFNVGSWTLEMDKVHSDWCRDHFINPSSVKQISQYVALAMNTLYYPELSPEWLKCQDLEPVWNSDKRFDVDMYDIFSSIYGMNGREMPYTLVGLQQKALSRRKIQDRRYACIHFLNGSCSFGDDCRNAHSFDAARPPCRFQDRCTNSSCLYSHSNDSDRNAAEPIVAPICGKFNGGPLMWYRQHASSLLLLDQGCGFQQSLETLRISLAMSLKLPATTLHTNVYLQRYSRMIDRVAVNFPRASSNASAEDNEHFLRGFFMSVAAYFRSNVLNDDFEVGIALRGKEFSRWNALSSAQNAGFCLHWSEEFDCAIFPRYRPHQSDDDEMHIEDAQFYVFRLKRNVHQKQSKMIRLRDEARFGVELEMSTSAFLSPQMIANELKASGIRIKVPKTWDEGKQSSSRWKIVTDSSLACNPSIPNCNVFELVSPILRSEEGISSIKHILQHFPSVRLNKSMGFHVHIDVEKYSVSDLVKIFQQFLKYEDAIDSMMPRSRRTGSAESNSFFKSNLEMAKQALGRSKEGIMVSLSKCRSLRDLAHIVNPTGQRYYKLNIQNLIHGRQTTLEFRQHSSTADFDKVSAWVRFCIRLCENSVSLEQSPLFNIEDTSVDTQFDDLFRNVIRDTVLYDFYRKRRQVLAVDDEGDACCIDCANGRGRCSK